MNAILTLAGKKPITGKVLQDGFGRITLIVPTSDGAGTMKSFAKHKYVISYF